MSDRSAPGVRVVVLRDERASVGEPWPLGDRLLSFSYEDSASKVDKVTLELENADLALFEHPVLLGGSLLEVSWGYPDLMAPPRRVVVKRLKGFTTLTAEAHSLGIQLGRQQRTRTFEQASRADVARKLAREHGYVGPVVQVDDTEEIFDAITQNAESDAHLLRRLAAAEDFLFYVDHSGFHFHPRRAEAAPARALTWYGSPGEVLSVQVESDLLRRTGKVSVRGRDPLAKRTLAAKATGDSVPRTTLGQVVEVVDPETGTTALEARNATAAVRPSPASTSKRIEREANARFRAAEQGAVKLTLQVIGDPTLAAKTVLDLRGLGTRLSGKYLVREAKHTIGANGYTCDLKLHRDAHGRATAGARKQGGKPNRGQPHADGMPSELERVDAETGVTRIEYRSPRGALGQHDPEGQRRRP